MSKAIGWALFIVNLGCAISNTINDLAGFAAFSGFVAGLCLGTVLHVRKNRLRGQA